MARVVVVGAGMAGVTAARAMSARGHAVTVLEQGGDVGGRLATLKSDEGLIDTGAPTFLAREPSFRALLDPLVQDGTLRAWAERLTWWDGERLVSEPLGEAQRRWAAGQGLAAAIGRLAAGLDVRLRARAEALDRSGAGWSVRWTDESTGLQHHEPADVVILAMPAPQARSLVTPSERWIDASLIEELERIRFAPSLVLAAAWDEPAPRWRALASTASPLAWAGVESSKRPGTATLLAVHADEAFSSAHLDAADSHVGAELVAALERVGGEGWRRPRWTKVVRWRWARPTLLASARALLSEKDGPPLVVCGDWCHAPTVEGAFLSGEAAAERLLFAGLA